MRWAFLPIRFRHEATHRPALSCDDAHPMSSAAGKITFIVLGLAGSASAQAPSDGVVAPAGGGQGVLAARVSGNDIAYKACAQAPCVPASGDTTVQLPLGTSVSDVVIEPLAIGAGRHVLWAHTPIFGALLAAVPGGAPQARLLWSGALGFSKGELGERYGEYLDVTEPEPDRTVRVLLGEVREDVAICGRRSLLAPKVLDPKDLAFKGVRLQRLGATNGIVRRCCPPCRARRHRRRASDAC